MADEKPAIKLNLRQRILNAPKLQEERLHVDEWGCDVIIRELTGKERAAFLSSVTTKQGGVALDKYYADIAIVSVIDPETGEHVFEPADRDTLNAGSGNALERIALVAKRVSALDPAAFKAAEKNS